MNSDSGVVLHNPDENRFEVRIGEHLAVLTYIRLGNTVTFAHTGVPPVIENRGIGSRLVRAGLEYARENGLTVQSMCWFVNKYIHRNPEYQDLLA